LPADELQVFSGGLTFNFLIKMPLNDGGQTKARPKEMEGNPCIKQFLIKGFPHADPENFAGNPSGQVVGF